MKPVTLHKTVVAFSLMLLTLTAGAVSREKDPVWQKLTEIDGRVLRIERIINNQSLLEMAQRNDDLQQQLRTLTGQIEDLQHSVDQARAQVRDAVADLDKRVTVLEASKTAMVATEPAGAATPTVAGSTAAAPAVSSDRDAYQAAFDLLKASKLPEAIAALNQFMKNYPQSSLLDNAQYWLGEAHYVGKDYPSALHDFQAVLNKYPTSEKAPDALLKLGFTQYEMKDYKAARANLMQVTSQYRDSKIATLAQQRLAMMSAQGQ